MEFKKDPGGSIGMKKQIKIWLGVLSAVAIVAVTAWYLGRHSIDVLQPAGQIGRRERELLIVCSLLSVTVVIPVFWLLFHFAWKYREGNKKAAYHPDQHGNNLIEAIWWLIPTLLLIVISMITWRTSHTLDPYRPLADSKKTLHVQVVAMDWKWLFIYPDLGIASVNEAAIPVNTPVRFDITSDAVMSSFWVPKLGGQVYAMNGMSTTLHLDAAKTGDYRGVNANIGGKGFADMHFTVKAVDETDYVAWIAHAKQMRKPLNDKSYATLARPAVQKEPLYYSSAEPGMYDTIVMKYMGGHNMHQAER